MEAKEALVQALQLIDDHGKSVNAPGAYAPGGVILKRGVWNVLRQTLVDGIAAETGKPMAPRPLWSVKPTGTVKTADSLPNEDLAFVLGVRIAQLMKDLQIERADAIALVAMAANLEGRKPCGA